MLILFVKDVADPGGSDAAGLTVVPSIIPSLDDYKDGPLKEFTKNVIFVDKDANALTMAHEMGHYVGGLFKAPLAHQGGFSGLLPIQDISTFSATNIMSFFPKRGRRVTFLQAFKMQQVGRTQD